MIIKKGIFQFQFGSTTSSMYTVTKSVIKAFTVNSKINDIILITKSEVKTIYTDFDGTKTSPPQAEVYTEYTVDEIIDMIKNDSMVSNFTWIEELSEIV